MNQTANVTSEDITTATRAYIVENFLFGDERDFAEDESFLQSGLIDSTGILELVQYLEETYGFAVEDHEMVPENLDSLRNVTEFVLSRTADRPT